MKLPNITLPFFLPLLVSAGADDLASSFRTPPDSARPGVYWYFMDGNLSRQGMTRDLESMKAAGLGHLVFLEVNVGVPRGPVDFLSEPWQELFAHAVREAERLGIEITLGSGPGWTGSGGPWVRPEQSMQHLVASKTEVQGPGKFGGRLPIPPPHRPFFGDVPEPMRPQWQAFYKDIAVLAFPTPASPTQIPDIEEKSLVYRAPFSSQPNVKPRLDAPAEYPMDPSHSIVPLDRVLDLTAHLKPDGTFDWEIPSGPWTILRFVSRNNGASTRPAPDPGIGFECDKFDASALDAHFDRYAGTLLRKVGSRQQGRGWTMLHMDSWEMGAQNWSPRFREEFQHRRGYDPQPFYPVYLGYLVGSRELSERFLWDLRITGQELVIENHAEHLKKLGRKHGFHLSIEPYDMNPVNDFDLGAVADVPMCEFWSLGFDTAYSCHTASSIAHVLGRPVVAAEAFTADHQEAWRFHPGSLKNQGDWALAIGINRLTYHTFAHKPDEGRPGMVMGPYGVHWDRGQTWWPMVRSYHDYIARCQYVLRQGRSIADVLYLMPEGAPNVFQPPASAFSGANRLPDRRGHNFDGCSAQTLITLAKVRRGQIVFPSGAAYQLLVLPNCETMTPELAHKLESLIKAGATVMGNPPIKSPSLVDYPRCDLEVSRCAKAIWGNLRPPDAQAVRRYGKGRVVWGRSLFGGKAGNSPAVLDAQQIGASQSSPQLALAQDPPSLYPPYDLAAAVLRDMGIAEDFAPAAPVRYTHRRTQNRDIYFLSNCSEQPIQASIAFRTATGWPELWDPIQCEIRRLPQYGRSNGITTIPLRFESHESYFIVFPTRPRAAAAFSRASKMNFIELSEIGNLDHGWDVSFDVQMGAPAQVRFDSLDDWTHRPEPGIKYYSGIANYRTTFDMTAHSIQNPKTRIFLDLGRVEVMARVRVNGNDCGVAWTAPWRVDISKAVKPGGNTLEIEIANLWPNRMIGDATLPEKQYTRTTYRPYKAGDPLLPSGLLGPVRLMQSNTPASE